MKNKIIIVAALLCLANANCGVYVREKQMDGFSIGRAFSSKQDSALFKIEFGIVNAKRQTIFRNRKPIPDSTIKTMQIETLRQNGIEIWNLDYISPISAFNFKSKDSSVAVVVEANPTLVPYSNFGEMYLRLNQDGTTEIIGENKKNKSISISVPLRVQNKKPSLPEFITQDKITEKKHSWFWYYFNFQFAK